jgi:hypothetical protein
MVSSQDPPPLKWSKHSLQWHSDGAALGNVHSFVPRGGRQVLSLPQRCTLPAQEEATYPYVSCCDSHRYLCHVVAIAIAIAATVSVAIAIAIIVGHRRCPCRWPLLLPSPSAIAVIVSIDVAIAIGIALSHCRHHCLWPLQLPLPSAIAIGIAVGHCHCRCRHCRRWPLPLLLPFEQFKQ